MNSQFNRFLVNSIPQYLIHSFRDYNYCIVEICGWAIEVILKGDVQNALYFVIIPSVFKYMNVGHVTKLFYKYM